MIKTIARSHALSRSLVAAAVLGLAGTAFAADRGIVVGGSLGKPDWDASSVGGVSGDSSGTGLKLYGGYRFGPHFAIEGGAVDLGKLKGPAGSAKARGAYIDAVGLLPVAPQWTLLGRVGLADVKLSTPRASERGSDAKLGLGVQYDLSSQLSLRGEWERYDVKAFGTKPKIDLYSVGLNYAF